MQFNTLLSLLLVISLGANISLYKLYDEASQSLTGISRQIPDMIEKSYKTGCLDVFSSVYNTTLSDKSDACSGAAKEYAEPVRKLFGTN